jgi:hypothetical protein
MKGRLYLAARLSGCCFTTASLKDPLAFRPILTGGLAFSD